MIKSKISLVFLLVLLPAAFVMAACSPQPQGPDIEIEGAWARPSPMAAGNGAVYMIIKNNGDEEDALIGAGSEISAVVELHETTMENDVMRMRPVEGQRIVIPAKSQVELKPAGLHIMLIDLKEKLEPGAAFPLKLSFEKSGERSLDVEVRAIEGMNKDAEQ